MSLCVFLSNTIKSGFQPILGIVLRGAKSWVNKWSTCGFKFLKDMWTAY